MYLIDANIFLELELKQDAWLEAKEFLKKVCNGEITAIMTDFCVHATCLVMQNNKKNPSEIRLFLSSLTNYNGLKIHALSIEEQINTTKIMEKYKLDFDDALNVQAMNSNNIKEIVSFDSDFDKVKEIKRIEPKEAIKKE